MIRLGGGTMMGCSSCSTSVGIGRSLFDESDAEFFAPPAGWFLYMGDGLLPGHVTMKVYCSEACGRKGEPWASEFYQKEIGCAECEKTSASSALGRKGKVDFADPVLLVLAPGWFVFSADGGESFPGRAVLLLYCSEACVRKSNEAFLEE